MPGLSGFFDRRGGAVTNGTEALERMLAPQMRREWLLSEQWLDGPFGAGRVHNGIAQPQPQPAIDERNGLALLIQGELHGKDASVKRLGLAPEEWSNRPDAELILTRYAARRDWDFLSEIDGAFTIALVDSETQTLTLVSDMFGLRPLYYWQGPGIFAFSSELKSFFDLPGFNKNAIDELALGELLSYGHMLEDRTWFEDVRLLQPGTVLEVSRESITSRTYWTWDDLPNDYADIGFDEAVEEMGRLWERAVRDATATPHTYSQRLSGGLDSRAILAAAPPDILPMPCFTFGRPGCDDIRIASEVARLKKCPHHVFGGHQDSSWIAEREPFVRQLDGMCTVLHLHGVPTLEPARSLSQVMLDGFLGDATAGGSYLTSEPDEAGHLRALYGRHLTAADLDAGQHMVDVWRRGQRPLEQFRFLNRGRRYILLESVMHLDHLALRAPFVSRGMLLFSMGMPREYRRGAKVYHAMLLERYPEFFATIPWETTGLPINAPDWRKSLQRRWRKLRAEAVYKSRGLLPVPRWAYLDYAAALREPQAQAQVREKLLDGDRPIHSLVPRERIEDICDRHFRRASRAQEAIGSLLSAEMFLEGLWGTDP